MGIGARQHDKAHRFRYGHEIADDIGMCNRNRTTFGNLLFKNRDDRTVAAQNIAETHSNKFGLDIG